MGAAHLLGYHLMRGLLGGSALQYAAHLALLALAAAAAFTAYRFGLRSGLRGYTSGCA